jgi:two-component system phosphate regulon response regulator PhoB
MGRKILIVEDDTALLTLTKYVLEGAGYKVETCVDGGQALADISNFKPELILLDVLLPGIDGYSLALELAKRPATKDIPIIVISGLARTKILFQGVPQIAAFMAKPWETGSLLENITLAFRIRPQPA